MLLASLPAASHAQSTPSPDSEASTSPASVAARQAGEVVVSGRSPSSLSSIDRKNYKVSADLQSGAGSASDVLRNLPPVDVDAQGNVSLRGDTNVQVLIDGKPSTTMSPLLRADTLQQFPANMIDHIEVITNPSAQFRPDGSGGIINIVTRKSHAPGASGAAHASAGTDGRYNLGVDGSYRRGPLSVSAGVNLRRDVRWRPFLDRRTEIDPTTGQRTNSSQDSLFTGAKVSHMVNGGVDYDLTPRDRLSASGSYNHKTGSPRIEQHNVVTDNSGATLSDYDRTGRGHEDEVDSEISAKLRHDFVQKDRQLTLTLRRGESVENESRIFTNFHHAPQGPITIDEQIPRGDELEREATAEYAQPLGGGKLLAGYDVQRNDDDYLDRGELIDPATGSISVDPARTSRFLYAQTVHAWYATYDRRLAKSVTAILGVRLEQAIIGTNQIDLGLRGHQSYFRAYPTVHLQYEVADGQDLKFSYSHRVARPQPEDLNPYPVFSDPLNLRAGNPNLKPQQTHAFEAAYQFERRGLSLEATLFLRRSTDVFTDVSRFITPTQLLTTKENLGSSTNAGLDFAGNGKIRGKISYRLSGSISRNTIDAANLGFAGSRSALAYTLKGGLDYEPDNADLVQLTATQNGKRLTPQGYRLPSFTANLGYRHRFKDGVTAVVSLSDLFNSQRDRMMLNDAVLIRNTARRNARRSVSVALTIPFGGKRTTSQPAFDFADQ